MKIIIYDFKFGDFISIKYWISFYIIIFLFEISNFYCLRIVLYLNNICRDDNFFEDKDIVFWIIFGD